MKNIVKIVSIFVVLFMFAFVSNIYAATLSDVDITATKTTVKSGENVTVEVDFGTELGSYTVDVAYDNTLFDYVSATGGTANNLGSTVRVVYFYQEGQGSPRSNMSVTFKAKEGITTDTQTRLTVSANSLANPDASVEYDDIAATNLSITIQADTTTPTPAQNLGTTTNPTTTNNEADNGDSDNDGVTTTQEEQTTNNQQPTTTTQTLPKTGTTVYSVAIATLLFLTAIYIVLIKK